MADQIGSMAESGEKNAQAKTALNGASQLAERAQKIAASTGQIATEWGGAVMDSVAKIPAASKTVVSRVDKHARANPWMHVGIASVGFLALGFLLGRQFSGAEFTPAVKEDDLADE